MGEDLPSADRAVLDLLRTGEAQSIDGLAARLGVTRTAVRQRLTRLLSAGLIQRLPLRAGRGRPTHQYSLTSKGDRTSGVNFADLATVLWQEIRAVADPKIRQGLLQRVAQRLAIVYSEQIRGQTVKEKMRSLVNLFDDRKIPFRVEGEEGLPVLQALACPYPELAAQDRSICAMERMMLSEVLGEKVTLSQCRLDGDNCCTFRLN